MLKKILNLPIILLFLFLLNNCGGNIFKRADVKDTPINVNERVKKNIEEGRGIRFGKGKSQGGVFDFASSNELWRASIDVLDFVPFTNASYSGGILITEWFDGNSKNDSNKNRDLKITVRFLSNEIRADAIDVNIHERMCENNTNNCSVNKIESNLENKIKVAILKRAALLEKNARNKDKEKFKKSGKRVITESPGN